MVGCVSSLCCPVDDKLDGTILTLDTPSFCSLRVSFVFSNMGKEGGGLIETGLTKKSDLQMMGLLERDGGEAYSRDCLYSYPSATLKPSVYDQNFAVTSS